MKWNASRQVHAGARLTGAGCSIFTDENNHEGKAV